MGRSAEIAERAIALAQECIDSSKPALDAVAGDDLQALITAATQLKQLRRDGDAKTVQHVAYSLVAMTFENAKTRLKPVDTGRRAGQDSSVRPED